LAITQVVILFFFVCVNGFSLNMVSLYLSYEGCYLVPPWVLEVIQNSGGSGRITGWWLSHPSEKYEFVSWDDEIPN